MLTVLQPLLASDTILCIVFVKDLDALQVSPSQNNIPAARAPPAATAAWGNSSVPSQQAASPPFGSSRETGFTPLEFAVSSDFELQELDLGEAGGEALSPQWVPEPPKPHSREISRQVSRPTCACAWCHDLSARLI